MPRAGIMVHSQGVVVALRRRRRVVHQGGSRRQGEWKWDEGGGGVVQEIMAGFSRGSIQPLHQHMSLVAASQEPIKGSRPPP